VPVATPPFVFASVPARLPANFAAGAITPDNAPLRICIIIRTDAKPGVSPLVPIRETLDARVYLGCITDAAGAVIRYVELWVQDPTGLGRAPAAYRNALTNHTLDERWVRMANDLASSDSPIITCGWESTHPAPLFLDAKTQKIIPPRDERTGASWNLCTDESLLERKGLPAYGTTLSRHLYQPDLADTSEVLPVDLIGGEPSAIKSALGLAGTPISVNPGGGLMLVTPLAECSFEHFCDALSGHSGEAGDADSFLRVISASALGATNGKPVKQGGWLGLSGVGQTGRMIEALHVKLMLLAGAASHLHAAARRSQAPLLNITADSLRVRLTPGLSTLPLWWAAQTVLVVPGEALELPIPNTSTKYFVAPSSGGMSIYAPASIGQIAGGKGWLRLRNVSSEGDGTILEGTLSTQERLAAGTNDLLWLRLSAGPTRIDLHATVDAGSAMATGELRLRTVPTRLTEGAVSHLRSALGVPIPDVAFELVPLLSTPCDLYSFGVLAVRTLLAGGKRSLPVALDDVLSLALHTGRDADSGRDLATRIGLAFESDKRFTESLGPQSLLVDCPDATNAFDAVPPRLWFGVLAFTIRCLTGVSPDSRCRDFGDAPAGAIHRVFDGPLEDLYALLSSCRALIVPDHALNREIRSVVKDCLASAKK